MVGNCIREALYQFQSFRKKAPMKTSSTSLWRSHRCIFTNSAQDFILTALFHWGLPRRMRMLNQVCQYVEVHEEEQMTTIDWRAVLCIGVLLTSYGCVTNATTELLDGTTAAAADIAKAVTDFTSSTTPGAGGAQNPVRVKKRLQVFTASSYDNLRSDISRGSGEYLVSLATLAGVPSAQFPEFQSLMQDSYSTMFDDVIPAAE